MAFKMKGPPYNKSALKHKVNGVWHTSELTSDYHTDNTGGTMVEQGLGGRGYGSKSGPGKRHGPHSHKAKVKSKEQRNPDATYYD